MLRSLFADYNMCIDYENKNSIQEFIDNLKYNLFF